MGENGGKRRVQISFDELNKIRILEEEDFKQTASLATESGVFSSKLTKFQDSIGNLVTVLDYHSQRIEHEKMLALGQRNRVRSETETRERRQAELQYLLLQQKGELQRANDQYLSLLKIEADQRMMLEALSKT